MIERQASSVLLEKATRYPISAITGPHQLGQSTLAKALFLAKPYCNFEELDHRRFASKHPRRFLAQFPERAILNEVQHCVP